MTTGELKHASKTLIAFATYAYSPLTDDEAAEMLLEEAPLQMQRYRSWASAMVEGTRITNHKRYLVHRWVMQHCLGIKRPHTRTRTRSQVPLPPALRMESA